MQEVNAKNVAEFVEKLRKKQGDVKTEMGKAIAQSCAKVQSEAQKGMTNTQVDTSKSYFTHNKTKAHHPSLPFNPPAVDTGTLRRSISYTVDEEKMEGRVGTTINNPPYGAYLELAEYGSSRMQPRPWLKPALEKSKETIKKLLGNAFSVGLKK